MIFLTGRYPISCLEILPKMCYIRFIMYYQGVIACIETLMRNLQLGKMTQIESL